MKFDVQEFLTFTFSFRDALWGALITTITMAVIAQILGVLLGLVSALAGRSKNPVIRLVNGLYVWFFRGTPVLVQILLLYLGLPQLLHMDPFPNQYGILPLLFGGRFVAATLALGVNEGAYMSEIIRAGILSVDAGQAEAAKSLGMTPRKTMSRIVLPQAMRVIIPPLGNEFNNMIKTTSLASVISVVELTLLAGQRYGTNFKNFEDLLGICVWYLFFTTIWSLIQGRIERRLGVGQSRNDDTAGMWSRLTGVRAGRTWGGLSR